MAQAAPTYNYETDQADLIRRQRIADAMAAQSLSPMGPTETAAGGIAVKRSPLEGIAKVLQAYMSKSSSDKIKGQETELGNRYQADLKSGMNDLISGMNAQPGAVPEVQGNNPSAFVPAHTDSMADAVTARRKAVMDAIASNHPVLKDLGMSILKQQQAGQLQAKDLKDMATPESVIANPNDPSKWVPKVQYQQLQPGQAVAGPGGEIRTPPVAASAATPGGPAGGQVPGQTPVLPQVPGQSPLGAVPQGFTLIDSKPGYDMLKDSNGDLFRRTASGIAKVDQAPKVTVNNSQNHAVNKLSDIRADTIAESYKNTKDIPQMLATLGEATQALDAGIHSGATGEVAMALSKVAKSLGMGDVDPAVANTEQYRANMVKQMLPIIEKMKPASDTDVKIAQEAAGGKITLDDATLLRLVKTAQAGGYNQLFAHQRLLDQNRNAPGMEEGGIDTFTVPFHFTADPKHFTYDKNMGVFSPKGPPPVAGHTAGLQSPTVGAWPGK